MKRLFVLVLLCVFMAVAPVVSAFADNNQTCDGRIENYVSATGTVAQNGTPTPTNPIEPTFYQQGDMVLRKVGDYADSYDATTGKITRRVGVKVLDGTNFRFTNMEIQGNYIHWFYATNFIINYISETDFNIVLSSHFVGGRKTSTETTMTRSGWGYVEFLAEAIGVSTIEEANNFLVQQANAGTPVTVWYPLTEAVEETVGTTYCADTVKIATTAYNAARFNPVKTDLNSAVATIREIVTNTINQTSAIASLQADKQTRPEDACPAEVGS